MGPADLYIVIASASLAIAAVVAAAVAYRLKLRSVYRDIEEDRAEAARLRESAKEKLESERRELRLAAKEETIKLRDEIEAEMKTQRDEVEQAKRRLEKREDRIAQASGELDARAGRLRDGEAELGGLREELQQTLEQHTAELQRISGLSEAEAKEILLRNVEEEIRQDANVMTRQILSQAQEDGLRRATDIVTQAIQRCAVDHTAESTVSVVALPSDDMKGRIIGREGRNIRCFEQATGVDLIVDDTPEAVVLSGFDAVRREIARNALEALISDGRIHPGRIEEMVERARTQVEEEMKKAGEQATFETGVSGLHPELVRMLGKLRFRTSYGQNVLKHSIEVAHLAGAMAGEAGARVAIARRAGLLHDIGKAVDYERDGSHALIGADIGRSRQEPEAVIHAIAAHHEEVPIESVEAFLVQAADAISAARPGARRETLETYLKRLEGLEQIAKSFSGVDKCYAIQAGREVRVIVKPERVDDLEAHRLAKGMAERIQSEMEYPGQIRVTVIRETRAVEYAQ